MIQSVYVEARITDADRSAARPRPYDMLAPLSASAGVLVARVAATAGHRPGWAKRAQVLDLLGETDAALAACQRAAGLTEDPAEGGWLLSR